MGARQNNNTRKAGVLTIIVLDGYVGREREYCLKEKAMDRAPAANYKRRKSGKLLQSFNNTASAMLWYYKGYKRGRIYEGEIRERRSL